MSALSVCFPEAPSKFHLAQPEPPAEVTRVKWTDIPVHVIDFEGSARSGIVEFGVVTLLGGSIASVVTRACRPRARMAATEVQVHRLAEAELSTAEPFDTEWDRFAGLRETGLLAAHFCATENALLRAAWPCPRLSPDFLAPARTTAEWGPWIDTGRLATETLPAGIAADLTSVVTFLALDETLHATAERFCPPTRRGFHCAGFDAIAAALVLQRIAREPDGEPWTLARVVTASTADRRQRDERGQARLF